MNRQHRSRRGKSMKKRFKPRQIMGWRRKKKGKNKGQAFPVVPRLTFEQARRNPSWNNRPGWFLKGDKVQEAVFTNGAMIPVDSELKEAGSMVRGYKTPEQTCPDLTPTKAVQRQELADKLKGGTVLETHAGKGHLSEVYAKKADKIVMVDKNADLLKKAEKKVGRKAEHEAVVSDNVEWLENEMKPNELKRLKLVDFDAFGSPAKPVRAFFNHFKVKKKMIVALTDGSKIFLGYKKGAEANKWLKENYGIVHATDGTREDQVKILDAFMKAQGTVHNFNVRPLNVAYGKHHAVYAGYEISPK